MSLEVVRVNETVETSIFANQTADDRRRRRTNYEWLREWLDDGKEEEKFWIEQIIKLVEQLSCKDIETTDHARRVAAFSLRLGIELGLPSERLSSLWTGSLLHDIGKITVPDNILKKPGPLDEKEWKVMRQHPRFGKRLLVRMGFPEDVWIIAAQHHEHFDGNGYPYNLKGQEIHVFARIFAVVDTYDAITSNRCYRSKSSHGAACEEILRVSGTQLDQGAVDAFTAIRESEWNESKLKAKGYLKEFTS